MNMSSLESQVSNNIVNNIIHGEWPTVLARLQYCIENGLLLHGSPFSSIDILRVGLRPICATNSPALAMMYAIRPNDTFVPLSKREIWAVENQPSQNPKIWATKHFLKKAGPGTIYVVEPDQFRQGKIIGEYVAFSPVRPVARIDVEPSDLPCKVGRLSKKMADYYRAVLVRQSEIFPW